LEIDEQFEYEKTSSVQDLFRLQILWQLNRASWSYCSWKSKFCLISRFLASIMESVADKW